jgi:hypothetical protein
VNSLVIKTVQSSTTALADVQPQVPQVVPPVVVTTPVPPINTPVVPTNTPVQPTVLPFVGTVPPSQVQATASIGASGVVVSPSSAPSSTTYVPEQSNDAGKLGIDLLSKWPMASLGAGLLGLFAFAF